jgi:hypothetical protein
MLHLCFISFAFVGICPLGPPPGQVSRNDRPGSVVPTTHLAIFSRRIELITAGDTP